MAPRSHARRGSPRAIAVAAFCAALAGGCSGARDLPPTSVAPVAVAVIDNGAPRRALVSAFDAAVPAEIARPRTGDERIYVLYFTERLPFAPGTYVEAADAWGRPLAPVADAFFGSWASDAWDRVDPATLRPFSIPLESPIACARRGGCFVEADALECTAPCPAPPEPAAPLPPEPPVVAPCPAGWEEDAHACRPYAGSPPACASTDVRVPAGPCRAPGPPCAGEWAADLDDARTIFVRPGAAGGDGTRARPLATVREALTRAPGKIVAISTGDHGVEATLTGQVIGACADGSRLTAAAPLAIDAATIGSLTLSAPALTVSAASLVGARAVGAVRVGARLELRDALVVGDIEVGAGAGLALLQSRAIGALAAASSASISIDRSWIDGSLTAARTPVHLAQSVVVGSVSARDGSLRIERSVIEARDVEGPALSALGDPTVEIDQLLVGAESNGLRFAGGSVRLQDTRIDDGFWRAEAVVADGVTLTLRRVSVGGDFMGGVRATNAMAPIVVEDLDLARTHGVSVDLGAPSVQLHRAEVRNTIILRTNDEPLREGPPVIDVSDLRASGGIMRVRDSGHVRLARLHLSAMRGTGLIVDATPSSPWVEASDVVVEGTLSTSDCESRICMAGAGVVVEGGGLELSRFRLEGNTGSAIRVQRVHGPLSLRDGVIAAQRVAVALEVEPPVLRAVLTGVRLVDVSEVCEPCGVASR